MTDPSKTQMIHTGKPDNSTPDGPITTEVVGEFAGLWLGLTLELVTAEAFDGLALSFVKLLWAGFVLLLTELFASGVGVAVGVWACAKTLSANRISGRRYTLGFDFIDDTYKQSQRRVPKDLVDRQCGTEVECSMVRRNGRLISQPSKGITKCCWRKSMTPTLFITRSQRFELTYWKSNSLVFGYFSTGKID